MGAARSRSCASVGRTRASAVVLPGNRPVSVPIHPATVTRMVPIALTIAGSDPSGGAGIQADLKTFHQLGVYGTSAITLITVQNTRRVSRVEILDPELVAEQIDAVLEDLPPNAVKTGALGNRAIIEVIASRKFNCPLVVDPVMLSSHGPVLGAKMLVPNATLVTPNLYEASVL